MEETILSLYERAVQAVKRRDRAAFIEIFHADVEFRSAAAQTVFRGRAGVNAWFDTVTAALVFQPTILEADPLDADVWYVSGRLQSTNESGALADRPVSWLVVLKDGLIWRYQPIANREEAEVVAHTLRGDQPTPNRVRDGAEG